METKHLVLIVDDEPSIRRSLAAYLEDRGYYVSCAASAEEALKILEENAIEVAVVDLRLPAMSGDVLVARSLEKRPGLRFIIHTGSVDYHLTEELGRLGVKSEHVFFKPLIDLTPLLDAIDELVTPPVS